VEKWILVDVFPPVVIPAQAGIQVGVAAELAWIPAFAGMTEQMPLVDLVVQRIVESFKSLAKNGSIRSDWKE
jgi:hypothetical protein